MFLLVSLKLHLLIQLLLHQEITRNSLLNFRIIGCLVLFYIMQAVEITILFLGTTIFLNKLSVIRI